MRLKRRALLAIAAVLICTLAHAGQTVPGSQYIDKHGGRTVNSALVLPDGGWAYWVIPAAASGQHTATIYGKGKYRADTLVDDGWQKVGEFSGTTSFPVEGGAVAVTARGELTVWAVGLE